MSNSFTRRWAELFLGFVFLSALSVGSAQAAGEGQCQCQAQLDPCLVGTWLVPAQALHPHWQRTAAHHLGLKVNRTVGQVELLIRRDRLFHAKIDFDSWAKAQAGLRLASRVTGSPVGQVCVARDGLLCTYGVRGDITVNNQLKMAGRSVAAPGMRVPAARQNQQAYPYTCTEEALELNFINLGKSERIKAQRR